MRRKRITTPNNIDVPEGKYCKEVLIAKAAPFDEVIYDWTHEEIKDYIKTKSKNNFIYIEFSYKQLGHNEEWFKEQCRDLNDDLLLIKREILLEWTKSSERAIFNEETLERISSCIRQPTGRLFVNRYHKFNFYESVDFLKPYIISCDVASGASLDATAITILDPFTLNVVAEFRDNVIDTEETKFMIESLVRDYFKNSCVVVERNNVGIAILNYLMKTKIERNLYREKKERSAESIEQLKKELVFTKSKRETVVYGIDTTGNGRAQGSRDKMFELLFYIVEHETHSVGTVNLYNDIKGLERNKKGKIEHSQGGHDDSLMSYLIARYVLAFGVDMGRYGIYSRPEQTVEHKEKVKKMNTMLSLANKDFKYEGLGVDILDREIQRIELQKKLERERAIERHEKKSNIFDYIYNAEKNGIW